MGAEACVDGALLANHGPANASYGCHQSVFVFFALPSFPLKDKLVAEGLNLLLQSAIFYTSNDLTSYPLELPSGRLTAR